MVAEMIAEELTKAKPGEWGCVQTREMWSTKEQVHLCPGHHWLFEFGDGVEGSSCEKLFSFPQRRTGVVCKGTRFYNGDRALRVKRWLHQEDEDAAGLTFEEWDPIKDADDSQTPVPMSINSSQLRGAGFNLQEVTPPALEAAARSGRRKRGAGLRQFEGMGRKRFVLRDDVKLAQLVRARDCNPEVVGSFPAKTQKTHNSNLHGFDLHRPSSKGTKLLLRVMKAIINQSHQMMTTNSDHDLSKCQLELCTPFRYDFYVFNHY